MVGKVSINCPNCGAPLKWDALYCEYCGTINQSYGTLANALDLHEQVNCLYEISCLQDEIEKQRQELENRKYEVAMREQLDRLSQKWQEAGAARAEVQNVIARNELVAQNNLTAYVEIPESKIRRTRFSKTLVCFLLSMLCLIFGFICLALSCEGCWPFAEIPLHMIPLGISSILLFSLAFQE